MKILRTVILTMAIGTGLITLGLAQALANPSVTYTIKNNSSSPIEFQSTSCNANGQPFPAQIPSNSTATVQNTSIYSGLYSCQVSYKKSSGYGSCKFTIARFLNSGFWQAPTITPGSGGTCSGTITSSSPNGNFTVELKHSF